MLAITFPEILIHTHGGLRWIVLIMFIVVLIQSIMGWAGKQTYSKLANILSAILVGFLHLQLLLGLILYVVGPTMATVWENGFGAAMKEPGLRYYAVEHILAMVVGIAIAQIGRTKSKKQEGAARFKTQTIWFAIALAIILTRIPWDRLG